MHTSNDPPLFPNYILTFPIRFSDSHPKYSHRAVDLPDTVEDAIIDTVIAAQLTTTTMIQQQATVPQIQNLGTPDVDTFADM